MDIKITEVIEAVKGKPLKNYGDAFDIHRISTDTRTIEKGDLFFALSGPLYDAHDFIGEAASKGAAGFVVSQSKKIPEALKKSCFFIVVEDVLTAYGDLAAYWRKKFHVKAVAITGSSGKTTVKELAAHLAGTKQKVLKNRGTENNLVGVPKTLLGLDASHELIILEMGTNRPGEIARLSEIISPQIAVVTQIGHSHLEGLKTIEGVKEEKLSLMNHLERGGLLILNGEDPSLADVQSGVHRIARVGFKKEGNDHFADQLWCHEKGISFHLDGKDIFEMPMIGRHNVINALLALSVCAATGVDLESAKQSLKEFKPVAGRLNLKTIGGIHFIDDTYNSNPTSFKAAMETLKGFKTRGKKGVVFGDMLELGDQAQQLHRRAGAALAEHLFDFVIAAGPLSEFAVDEAVQMGYNASKIFKVRDSQEAAAVCREQVSAGDMVLVKGSRGMKMEKVIECFTTSYTP